MKQVLLKVPPIALFQTKVPPIAFHTPIALFEKQLHVLSAELNCIGQNGLEETQN